MAIVLQIEYQIEPDGSVSLTVNGDGLPQYDFPGARAHDLFCANSLQEAGRLLALREYAQNNQSASPCELAD
jgi:hypothetical protein